MPDYNPPPPPEDFERHIVEHDMYVVNLSKGRIFMLILTAIVIAGLAFAGGWYLGTQRAPKAVAYYTQGETPSATNITIPISRAKTGDTVTIGDPTAEEDTKKSILDELSAADSASKKKLESELDKPAKKTTTKAAGKQSDETSSTRTPTETENAPATKTSKASEKKTADTKKTVGKGYFIQLAVSAEKKPADYECSRLKRSFPLTFVREETNKSGNTVYKIKMGRFAEKDEAAAELAKVKKSTKHKDAYIYFAE